MKYLYLVSFFMTSLVATDMRALLLHGNCITCHQKQKELSAPSVEQIKESYLNAFPQKSDFVEYMSKWVVKPNKKSSLMLQAVEKYELMPELGYDINTIREITAYIFETRFTPLSSEDCD